MVICAPESATASLTLSSMRPPGVAKDISTSKRGWLEWLAHSRAPVRATVAEDILASRVGEQPMGGGSNTCPPDAAAATLELLPLFSLLALLLRRKQSLHDSYGNWLAEPSGLAAKSVNSFPQRHLAFFGRAPFGGPPLGRAGCGLLGVSCLAAFL